MHEDEGNANSFDDDVNLPTRAIVGLATKRKAKVDQAPPSSSRTSSSSEQRAAARPSMLKSLRRANEATTTWSTCRQAVATFDSTLLEHRDEFRRNDDDDGSGHDVIESPSSSSKGKKSPYDVSDDDFSFSPPPLRRSTKRITVFAKGNSSSSSPSSPSSSSVASRAYSLPLATRVNEAASQMSSKARTNSSPKSLAVLPVVAQEKERSPAKRIDVEDSLTDNFEYWLHGMNPKFTLRVRCSNACSMLEECSRGLFRVHLRAANLTDSLFSALQDADSSSQLALVTSALFFVLSKDRAGLDVSEETVALLCRLLNPEISAADGGGKGGITLNELSNKIRNVLEKRSSIHGLEYLPGGCLTANSLASETLVAFAESRSGSKYLAKIHEFGGVQRLVSQADTLGREILSVKADSDVTELPHSCILYCRFLKFLRSFIQHGECLPYIRSVFRGIVEKITRVLSLLSSVFRSSEENCGNSSYVKCLYNTLCFLADVSCNNGAAAMCVSEELELLTLVLSFLFNKPRRRFESNAKLEIDLVSVGFLLNVAAVSAVSRVTMSNITVRESPKDDDDDTRDDVRTIPGLIDLFKTNNDFCSSFFSTVGAGYGMRGQTDDDSGVVQSQSSDDGSASSQPSMAAPFGLREMELKLDKFSRYGSLASYIALLLGCLTKYNMENKLELESYLVDDMAKKLVNSAKIIFAYMKLQKSELDSNRQSVTDVIEILESLSSTLHFFICNWANRLTANTSFSYRRSLNVFFARFIAVGKKASNEEIDSTLPSNRRDSVVLQTDAYRDAGVFTCSSPCCMTDNVYIVRAATNSSRKHQRHVEFVAGASSRRNRHKGGAQTIEAQTSRRRNRRASPTFSWGQVLTAGAGQNPARQEFPTYSVRSTLVNMLCGSGDCVQSCSPCRSSRRATLTLSSLAGRRA
ncbi:wings apart-like protein homolog [Oscarella lobularis]|uniref:wings apart-like protein homolog n=1 Tax=Oscarella lobularis TaxID=121494 RepID=UPI0033134C6F